MACCILQTFHLRNFVFVSFFAFAFHEQHFEAMQIGSASNKLCRLQTPRINHASTSRQGPQCHMTMPIKIAYTLLRHPRHNCEQLNMNQRTLSRGREFVLPQAFFRKRGAFNILVGGGKTTCIPSRSNIGRHASGTSSCIKGLLRYRSIWASRPCAT